MLIPMFIPTVQTLIVRTGEPPLNVMSVALVQSVICIPWYVYRVTLAITYIHTKRLERLFFFSEERYESFLTSRNEIQSLKSKSVYQKNGWNIILMNPKPEMRRIWCVQVFEFGGFKLEWTYSQPTETEYFGSRSRLKSLVKPFSPRKLS